MVQNSRNMVFISHAIEDNEFTLWLALQLAKNGYGVWCDLTKLLGGENWPAEINYAMQDRMQKFIFVLSKASNKKDNPLNELTLALNIAKKEGFKNFIIPLKIDDLGYDELDFRLTSIQTVSFKEGWAEGMGQLLQLFERENVAKNPSFTPNSVSLWWNENKLSRQDILNKPEDLVSNLYPISSMPEFIYAYQLKDFVPYVNTSFPSVSFNKHQICFLEKNSTKNDDLLFNNSMGVKKLRFKDLLEGKTEITENGRQGKYILVNLLNNALQRKFNAIGLKCFKLAGKKYVYYFDKNTLPNKKIIHGSGFVHSRTQLWGKSKDATWHWAIRAWCMDSPKLCFNIQPHVLVRASMSEIRPAPKNVYAFWNNHIWLEKMLASMLHLAGKDENIAIPVAPNQNIFVDKTPIIFKSPVSFVEPQDKGSGGNNVDPY